MISLTTRLSIFSLFFAQALSSQDEQTTCDIPSVEENQSTYLTCYYTVDMRLARRNLSVIYFDSEDQLSGNVLDCQWEHDDSQPTCQSSRGFQTPEIKGSEVKTRLLHASSSNVGKYSCIDPSLTKLPKRCSFFLLQRDSASVTQAAPVQQPLITPKDDTIMTAAVDNESIESSTAGLIVTAILIFVFIVSLQILS